MKRFGTIYIIKNTENGKVYVGQTRQSVSRRWDAHKRNKKSIISKVLKNNINKFVFIEFLTCFSKNELNFWEKSLIKQHNSIWPNGYNLTSGGNNFEFNKLVRTKMSLVKKGKESKNHIVGVLVKNIHNNELKSYISLKDACKDLNISRSSVLKSCKYGIVRKTYLFSYANQSGSNVNKKTLHAQRLEGEPVKAEYNPSTSPRFPQKYMDKKEEILSLSKKYKPHAISKKFNLDKSMLCYFIHCFGK